MLNSFNKLPRLQEFDISKNTLNDSCCTSLGEGFRYMPNLTSLNISGCGITASGLQTITTYFHVIPRLQQLFCNRIKTYLL